MVKTGYGLFQAFPDGNQEVFMEKYREFRSHERVDFDTPVLFYGSDSQNHQRAMMYNFSDHGMYFESSEPLRTGSEICVKTMEIRSINRCKVKWCGRIDKDGEELFGIGLQCEI